MNAEPELSFSPAAWIPVEALICAIGNSPQKEHRVTARFLLFWVQKEEGTGRRVYTARDSVLAVREYTHLLIAATAETVATIDLVRKGPGLGLPARLDALELHGRAQAEIAAALKRYAADITADITGGA